jgi:TonB family protein
MKNLFYSFLFLFFLFGLDIIAQEDKVDVMPEPIGGIEQILKNVVYPKAAKDAGIEGKVIVKAVIDEKGDVVETEVMKSVSEDCDKAAVDAIKKTKFTSGIKDDNPVKTEITIPIMFKLK